LDDLDHLFRFDVADVQVGRGHAAEDVRKRREESRPGSIQAIELADDSPDCVCVTVIRFGNGIRRRVRISKTQ
jgi:hypothetical protein